MPRLLAFGGGILLVLGIIAAVVVALGLGRSGPAQPSATRAPTGAGSSWSIVVPVSNLRTTVASTCEMPNGEAEVVTNPQTRVLVNLQGWDGAAQGYVNPGRGRLFGKLPTFRTSRLVIPAGQRFGRNPLSCSRTCRLIPRNSVMQ